MGESIWFSQLRGHLLSIWVIYSFPTSYIYIVFNTVLALIDVFLLWDKRKINKKYVIKYKHTTLEAMYVIDNKAYPSDKRFYIPCKWNRISF